MATTTELIHFKVYLKDGPKEAQVFKLHVDVFKFDVECDVASLKRSFRVDYHLGESFSLYFDKGHVEIAR